MSKSITLGDELTSWLTDELSRSSGRTAVQAGHFVIDCDGGWAQDHLADSSDEPAEHRGFVEFSRLSWETACQAAAILPASARPELMTLVNDWQFLNPKVSERRTREKLAAELRIKYFSKNTSLPEFHLETMKRWGIAESSVFRNTESCWLFSESELRNRLANTVQLAFRNGSASTMGLKRHFNDHGQPVVNVTSSLEDEYCLLYCGSTNCAGEVVQLLKDLYDRGVRRFINLYPMQCLGPVSTGTELAKKMFTLKEFEIINIAMPFLPVGDSSVKAIVDTYHF